MKYDRVLLITHHGYDGKKMELGKTLSSTTEYDREASICGLIACMLWDEKQRCEYLPKTKRQWEEPFSWKNDLKLIVKCSFAAKNDFFNGTYVPHLAVQFPRHMWRGDGPVTLVLGRASSLQEAQVTARDILRPLLFLL